MAHLLQKNLILTTYNAVVVAQIGINTENILVNALFIVDGAHDNPVTGAIGVAAQSNDIVVTQNGFMGVGTHEPTARLHINTQRQTGMFGFRLAETPPPGGLVGRIIRYRADGTAGWETVARTAVPVNVNVTDALPLPRGAVTPFTGIGLPFIAPVGERFFAFEIRCWGQMLAPVGILPIYEANLLLQRTRSGVTSVVDRFRFTMLSAPADRHGFTTTTSLYARTLPRDGFNVALELLQGTGDLMTANVSRSWSTTKVRII